MGYSIKAAAMATGITESRLRTWERRYGVPRPNRNSSGRRRFDEDDLNVIRRMSTLIDAGMPASEAADAVRMETGVAERIASSADAERTHPLVDLLVQKALAFDHGWLLRIIRDSVYSSGWAPTMERVAFPALSQLSREWAAARATGAHLRFAHEVLRGEVAAELSKLGPAAEEDPMVLLACAEADEFDIAALSLALLLRQRDMGVVYVGGAVPCIDLIETARQLEPAAICIVGTRRSSPGALNRNARAVVSSKLRTQLFVGGSILTRRDAPEIPGIHLPQSLVAATDRIAKSVGAAD